MLIITCNLAAFIHVIFTNQATAAVTFKELVLRLTPILSIFRISSARAWFFLVFWIQKDVFVTLKSNGV